MGGTPGNLGLHQAPMRNWDWMSVSLEHSTLTSQKVWREWLPCPGPPRHQQCSDHHPSSGPTSLHSLEFLTHSGKLVHLLQSQGCILLPSAVTSQSTLVFLWRGIPTHWEKDTVDLDRPARMLQKLTYPVWWRLGCGPCCLSQRNFQLHSTPVHGWPVASQSHPRGLLERHQSPVGPTVHHRVQSVMEKGSDLQTGGQVPRVCHLKRALGAWTWEETSHLFTILAKHQERSLWAPQGCQILPDLDTEFLWNCQAFV